MNFRGKLKSTVAVMFAAGMLVTGSAYADMLKVTPDENGIVVYNNETDPNGVSVGLLQVENGTDSFAAFCYELTQGVAYTATLGQLDFSKSMTVSPSTQMLFDQSYSSLSFDNRVQVAGFQIALWETQDDNNLGTGYLNNWNSLNLNVLSVAQGFLDKVNANAAPTASYQLSVWVSNESQDILQAAPVPEPETYAMFAVGLALLGLRRRKA